MISKLKIPTKHADCACAFLKGATIQFRKDATTEWTDTQAPNWHEDFEYRVKPEPAAAVYPETNLTGEEMHTIVNEAPTGTFPELRAVANAAIRRAIDEGQVVLVDDVANKAFDKRLELAEQALVDAGYVRVDAEGHWRKDDVVDATFDPDFQEVKGGETACDWHEAFVGMERLAEYHANEADKHQRMLRATERNLESVQAQCTDAVQRYQDAEKKMDKLDFLASRACRALCDYLGKSREDVSFEVIQAIILLERSK